MSISQKLISLLAGAVVLAGVLAWFGTPWLMGTFGMAMETAETELIRLGTAVAVGSGLTVALIAGAFGSRLARRIERVTTAAARVRSGEVETQVRDFSEDELGDLAAVFNAMTRTMARNLNAKDEFVAAVSHEVRTPLTAVLGLSSEIAMNAEVMDKKDIAELCEIIAAQTHEVSNIVEDLLTVARFDRGVLLLHPEPLEISREVDTALQSLPIEHTRKTDVRAVHVVASTDAKRLRQILRNLLTNAYRYGGSRVEVRVAPVSDDLVSIRVRDNGHGVEEDQAEAIFSPYFTAHPRDGMTESVGLGLTVSRKLAKALGGDLVYRRVGGWTVFELLIPRAEAVPEELDVLLTELANKSA